MGAAANAILVGMKIADLLARVLEPARVDRTKVERRDAEPNDLRDALDAMDHKTFDWLHRVRAATDGSSGSGSHG
jgi:hypothetical protein